MSTRAARSIACPLVIAGLVGRCGLTGRRRQTPSGFRPTAHDRSRTLQPGWQGPARSGRTTVLSDRRRRRHRAPWSGHNGAVPESGAAGRCRCRHDRGAGTARPGGVVVRTVPGEDSPVQSLRSRDRRGARDRGQRAGSRGFRRDADDRPVHRLSLVPRDRRPGAECSCLPTRAASDLAPAAGRFGGDRIATPTMRSDRLRAAVNWLP